MVAVVCGGEESELGDGRQALGWSRAGRESYPTAGLQLPSQISARLTSKAKLVPHLKFEALL